MTYDYCKKMIVINNWVDEWLESGDNVLQFVAKKLSEDEDGRC